MLDLLRAIPPWSRGAMFDADFVRQAQSLNGGRFRRARKIDPSPRSRRLQRSHLSAILPTKPESHAAVELDLTVPEEAVVVLQSEEAEVDEVAHQQMAFARKMSSKLLLQLSNQLHGKLLHRANHPGKLQRSLKIAGIPQSRRQRAGLQPRLERRLQLRQRLLR